MNGRRTWLDAPDLERLWEAQDLRAVQAAQWDPFTVRQLDEIGVTRGWHCLEIGTTTAAVAGWLIDRVGPTGSVAVTEIEPSAAGGSAAVDVHHRSGAAPTVERSGYDLIHTRLGVEPFARRDALIAKLAAGLAPGGWLVVEDLDLRTICLSDPPSEEWAAAAGAVLDRLHGAGVEPPPGVDGRPITTRLTALRHAGLGQLHAEAMAHSVSPAVLASAYLSVRYLPVRHRPPPPPGGRHLAGVGPVASAVERAVAALRRSPSELTVCSPMLVAVRGRRPPAPGPAGAAGAAHRR